MTKENIMGISAVAIVPADVLALLCFSIYRHSGGLIKFLYINSKKVSSLYMLINPPLNFDDGHQIWHHFFGKISDSHVSAKIDMTLWHRNTLHY